MSTRQTFLEAEQDRFLRFRDELVDRIDAYLGESDDKASEGSVTADALFNVTQFRQHMLKDGWELIVQEIWNRLRINLK